MVKIDEAKYKKYLEKDIEISLEEFNKMDPAEHRYHIRAKRAYERNANKGCPSSFEFFTKKLSKIINDPFIYSGEGIDGVVINSEQTNEEIFDIIHGRGLKQAVEKLKNRRKEYNALLAYYDNYLNKKEKERNSSKH